MPKIHRPAYNNKICYMADLCAEGRRRRLTALSPAAAARRTNLIGGGVDFIVGVG
jgi:hypothetical protein